MSEKRGMCTYPWEMKIDLDALAEYLVKKSGMDGYIKEYDLDGDTIIVRGEGTCRYVSDYTPATRYDPPEYDEQLIGSNEDIRSEIFVDAIHSITEDDFRVWVDCDFENADYEEE